MLLNGLVRVWWVGVLVWFGMRLVVGALVHGMAAWLVRTWWVGVLVWFGMRLVIVALYGGMAGKSLVGGCVGMVWYEACGWWLGAWYMVAWLVRAWWVGVLVWFGMRLVVGALYGGMAGKNLVGGCVGMVWYEACGWCMVWWNGW